MLSKMQRHWVTHTSAGGNVKAWQFLIKLNSQIREQEATVLLGIYTRKIKTYSHKNLYKNIYSNFFHNSQ